MYCYCTLSESFQKNCIYIALLCTCNCFDTEWGQKRSISIFFCFIYFASPEYKIRKTKSLISGKGHFFVLIAMYLTCTIIVLLNKQIDLYIANRVCLSKLGQVLKVTKYIPLFRATVLAVVAAFNSCVKYAL